MKVCYQGLGKVSYCGGSGSVAIALNKFIHSLHELICFKPNINKGTGDNIYSCFREKNRAQSFIIIYFYDLHSYGLYTFL